MESQKILLVEDEAPLRKVLNDRLAADGNMVIEASSAEQALEILTHEKPDLIVTDLIMFPMDGVTLLKRIRASGVWGAHVPCIVFSNQRDPEPIQEAKNVGIFCFLPKAETSIEDLVDAVHRSVAK